MSANAEKLIVYGVGALVLGAVLYVAVRGLGGAAQDVTRGAVNVAGGGVVGVVKGIGDVIGIPDTNPTQCRLAIAANDKWSALKYCDASTFTKFFFTGSE